LAASGCSDASKVEISNISACPAAVQKAFQDYANGVQFKNVEKDTKKDGRIVYEAKGKTADGRKIEIKVEDDGRLVKFESEKED